MVDYINEVRNLIAHNFSENWHSEFDSPDILDLDIKLGKFRDRVYELREAIFQKLNASILTGQYCKNGGFSLYLQDLQHSLQSIPYPIPPNETVQQTFQEVFNDNFIEAIKVGISLYINFAVTVERRFRFDNRKLIHYSNPKLSGILEKDSFDDDVNSQLDFLEANISVAYFDVELKPAIEDYNRLQTLRQRISEAGNIYSVLLKQKCDFLIAKWIFRQEHIHKEPVFSIIDNEEIEINVDTYRTDNPILSFWRKYIESHYELSRSWKAEIEKDYVEYKNINFEKATLKDLHRVIKYFKDVNRNLSQLTILRKEIQRRYEAARTSGTDSERYCYAIALNYAINNEFSLLIELSPQNEGEIASLYTEILLIQSQTTVKNFFPQYKYLELLVGQLEALYSARKALEFVSPARKIIDTCEQVIKTYKDNVDWSKLKYNYVFQLPYDESLIEIEGQDLPRIHVFSAFLLPIYKNKYITEFGDFKQRVNNLKSSIEVFENVELEMREFGGLKKEIKDRDLKSIEIIAIFTSIVTFIAGSIPSFKYIETAYQAGLFMFALSSSLGVFILLILSITRGIERLKSNQRLIWAFLLIGVVFWLLLVGLTNDPQKESQKIYDSRLDSFSRESRRIERELKTLTGTYDSVLKQSNQPIVKDSSR